MKTIGIVIGVSGASGAVLGLKVVELLSGMGGFEIHLVVSDSARRTLEHEAGAGALDRLVSASFRHYSASDIGAPIASGSYPIHGMIIAPCSMKTLAGIASGYSDTLLVRAADVQLKERRRLVLMARETPLHLGHLRNMCTATEMGAIIMPPVPAFHHHPQSVDDIVVQLAARAIDLLALGTAPLARPWLG